jgi:hypothetical protein
VITSLLQSQIVHATTFEPLGKALLAILGTSKVMKKSVDGGGGKSRSDLYYFKDPKGKLTKVAVVEKGIYPPDCTHTWAIELDPPSAKVKSIRVIEMSCQHAFPTRSASFMDQFIGVGPAQLKELDSKTKIVAKATGTSLLLRDAVKNSIRGYQTVQGTL